MPSKPVAVVTTSFGKARYLTQLKEALELQTTRDFQWYVLDNSIDEETRFLVQAWQEAWITVELHDFTDEERGSLCPHPVLLNGLLSRLSEHENFIHISDDDLPDPRLIDTLNSFLRYNRDKNACYAPMRMARQVGDDYDDMGIVSPQAPVIFGPKVDPLSFLDGNSVMLRLDSLKALMKPWPESWEGSEICDGMMLRRFCEANQIWPAISEPLLLHRVTELSAWRNAVHGTLQGRDAFLGKWEMKREP